MTRNCYYCDESTINKDSSGMLVLHCNQLNRPVIKFSKITQQDIDNIKVLHDCPFLNKHIYKSSNNSGLLDKIKPNVKLDDVVVGTTYHVPPYLNEKRKDIKIICKLPTGFSYCVVGSQDVAFAYEDDALAKLMVRPKN